MGFWSCSRMGKGEISEWKKQGGDRKESSLVDQMVKNLPTIWETWARSLGREDLLEQGMATHSVFLPGEVHDRGAWRATVHGITELDRSEQLTNFGFQEGAKLIPSALDRGRARAI